MNPVNEHDRVNRATNRTNRSGPLSQHARLNAQRPTRPDVTRPRMRTKLVHGRRRHAATAPQEKTAARVLARAASSREGTSEPVTRLEPPADVVRGC